MMMREHRGSTMNVHPWFAERRRQVRSAVREFAEAVRTSDPVRFTDALCAIDEISAWAPAMRAIARLSPTDAFRKCGLSMWVHNGDSLRSEINDDIVLVNTMRTLLPRYTGPAQTIYRGDSAINRRRRTYGLSWSRSFDVGREYALARRDKYIAGTVLLQAHALPDAIVCAPALLDDRYGEEEFVVDRRRLRDVKVLERFTTNAPLEASA